MDSEVSWIETWFPALHDTPWKINMELTITHLERNMIFQASIIMVHVKSSGVYLYIPSPPNMLHLLGWSALTFFHFFLI